MRAFAAAQTQFPGFGSPKTYASHRVWRESYSAEDVPFTPLPKREAVKIFHHARRFERITARRSVDAFGRVHVQGAIGRMGMLVLHALLFDFLNYSSGRLDPSHAAIADRAIVSVASVKRAMVKLKAAGVLNWVRRRAIIMEKGECVLQQETNAYGIIGPNQWRGYRPAPPPPPPDPASWGARPPVTAWTLVPSDSAAGMLHALESDPGNGLAAAGARLGRLLGHGK